MTEQAHVVIVGGGFAGLGCARGLAKHPQHARVTLIDQHAYHQFLPLLYQVATAQLAPTHAEVDSRDRPHTAEVFLEALRLQHGFVRHPFTRRRQMP